MSDATAVSILAKLTSWYCLDGDLTDAHGSYDLDAGVSVAGYEAGKHGQRMQANSRASVVLSVPITYNSGALTIGGWVYYSSAANKMEMALTTTDLTFFQILGTDAAFTDWRAGSYLESPGSAADANRVTDPRAFALSYPVTYRVTDSTGATATSDQVIRISDSGGALLPGYYFIAATWLNGIVKLYVDGVLAATSPSPQASLRGNTILRFMIGNTINGIGCQGAHDEAFFSVTDAFTDAEMLWLYNKSAGRSYAELVAAAA